MTDVNFKSVQEFSLSLEDAYEKVVNVPLKDVKDKIAMDLLKFIVFRTPVDTGRARGNTIVSIGEPDYSSFKMRFDQRGDSTFNEGAMKISLSTKVFEPIFIQNNLPYIMRLEHGWSPQARSPDGMFGLAVQYVKAGLGE